MDLPPRDPHLPILKLKHHTALGDLRLVQGICILLSHFSSTPDPAMEPAVRPRPPPLLWPH